LLRAIVVGRSFWAASQGVEALQVQWDEGQNALLDSAEISARFGKALAADGLLVTEQGSAGRAEVQTRITFRFLITHYPQPSGHGTKQEHTAVSAGLNGIAARVWMPCPISVWATRTVIVPS
jgi:hypothetical protein